MILIIVINKILTKSDGTNPNFARIKNSNVLSARLSAHSVVKPEQADTPNPIATHSSEGPVHLLLNNQMT